MKQLIISGRELRSALSYLAPSVGTKSSAQQEASLLYISVQEEDLLKLQVQSNILISSTTATCSSTEAVNLEMLIEFSTIDKYVKNNSINEDFVFNLDMLEEEEYIEITVGNKFIGTLPTIPLDAYEVQSFEDSVSVSKVNSDVIDSMISMSCQFANMKQDTQDYMQIVAQDGELIFFTSDGDTISKFTSKQDIEDDFDITVRASSLKKINNFKSSEVDIQLTDDEYFVILSEEDSLRAIVLHSDPPYSYHELDTNEEEHECTLTIPSESMISSLKNLECSSTDNLFNLHIQNDTDMKVYSENIDSSKTEINLDISIDNYLDILSGDTYKSSIILFRKLSNLTKDSGKLNLKMWTSVDDKGENFIDMIDACGTSGNVDYSISFGLLES
tara:strand:- start:399 stop:1562 length:1164 start_codon:yes stop_codon:yes gene_type:complete